MIIKGLKFAVFISRRLNGLNKCSRVSIATVSLCLWLAGSNVS